uniref:Uncharacterized protein n=1 Tax=Anopheles epiroticus TaxID=199890 RepID=A0A182PX24_9DIPT
GDRVELVSLSDGEGVLKTLGLYWCPKQDEFAFIVNNLQEPPNPPTKRTVLSEISKLFDPIGLLSPVIVIAKLIMQKIWVAGLPWDTQLEGDILQEWLQFRTSLQHVNNIRISRCLLYPNHIKVELHGFSDASKHAYGAALYLRCVYADASVSLRLICSKSRVAPVKPITIPRMELLGAHLLARLISKVAGSFNLQFSNIILWTDSQIVLAWLTKPSSALHVFVRNRVANIRLFLEPLKVQWKYISTKENPSDVVSRAERAVLEAMEQRIYSEFAATHQESTSSSQHSPRNDRVGRRERPAFVDLEVGHHRQHLPEIGHLSSSSGCQNRGEHLSASSFPPVHPPN